MSDLQVDAASGGKAFDMKLKLQLCKQLTTSDLHAIKFLLWSEHCPTSEIEKMETSIDLFKTMEQKGLLGESNTQLLGELFYFTHKIKLLKMLGYDPKQFKEAMTNGHHRLSTFKVLLIKLYYDMSSKEVETLKYCSEDKIGRHDIGKLHDALSLFMALEDRELLSCDDLSYLTMLLDSIDRADLLSKVKQYEGMPLEFFESPDVNYLPVRKTESDEKAGLSQSSHVSLPHSKKIEPTQAVSMLQPQKPPPVAQVSDPSKMTQYGHGTTTPKVQYNSQPSNYNQNQTECKLSRGTNMGTQAKSIEALRSEISNSDQNINRLHIQERHQMAEVWDEKKSEKSDDKGDTRLNAQQALDNSFLSMNASGEESDPETESFNGPDFSLLLIDKDEKKEDDTVHRQASEEEPGGQIQGLNLNVGQGQSDNTQPHQRSSDDGQRLFGRPASAEGEESATNDTNSNGNLVVNEGEPQVSVNRNTVPPNDEIADHVTAEIERLMLRHEERRQQERLLEEAEMPCYRMDRRPRGYCLIINNEHFSAMDRREGTDFDADNLKNLFTKLEFEVDVRKDQRARDMHRFLLEYAFHKEHDNFDCFACCILTHGDKGRLYGSDTEAVDIKDLTGYFRPHSCPSLNGKPKLFFMQACQGTQRQHVHDDIQDDAPSGARPVQTIPNEADFLMGYATVPGFVSYRSKSRGSWYINKLVESLNKYSLRYDLLSILTKVNEELSRGKAPIGGQIYGQVPAPMTTLRKRLFFR